MILRIARLDLDQIFGRERGLDVEVVVEAVDDRWTDAELGLGEELLNGLGQHVGSRVPHSTMSTSVRRP
jgi:hypothetical protein